MSDIVWLVTQTYWQFKIAEGKRGKWRWQLYDPSERHVCGSSVKGFDTEAEARADLEVMCEALDRKFLQSSVFRDE